MPPSHLLLLYFLFLHVILSVTVGCQCRDDHRKQFQPICTPVHQTNNPYFHSSEISVVVFCLATSDSSTSTSPCRFFSRIFPTQYSLNRSPQKLPQSTAVLPYPTLADCTFPQRLTVCICNHKVHDIWDMQVGLAEKTVDEYLFHVWRDIAIHKRLWFCFL